MWLLLSACFQASPAFDTTGTRTDRDDGGGSFAGGGDDTAVDTAGDTASDSGAEAICGAGDVTLAMYVEDEAEVSGTAFTWPTAITTRAVFTNPCDGRLEFSTPTSCLVDTWTLTDGTGADTTFSGNCVDSATTWTLDAREATSVTASWGELARSTYQVTASTALGRSTTEFFSVQ